MWRTVSDDILLSELVPPDRDGLVLYLAEEEISRQTAAVPFPYTAKHADDFIAWCAAETKRVGIPCIWAIREKSGNLIGCVGLHDVKPVFDAVHDRDREGSLGYWLGKPWRGKGIMALTVKKVCEVGFVELELDRIVAFLKKGNAKSEKVLERCGFTLEAELPGHYLRDGEKLDGRKYRKNAVDV